MELAFKTHASRSRDSKINDGNGKERQQVDLIYRLHRKSDWDLGADQMLFLSDWVATLSLVFGGCCRYAVERAVVVG